MCPTDACKDRSCLSSGMLLSDFRYYDIHVKRVLERSILDIGCECNSVLFLYLQFNVTSIFPRSSIYSCFDEILAKGHSKDTASCMHVTIKCIFLSHLP